MFAKKSSLERFTLAHALSNKERKKLLRACINDADSPSLSSTSTHDDEEKTTTASSGGDLLLKKNSATVVKASGGGKQASLFFDGSTPLFVDIDGRLETIVPTVMACWKSRGIPNVTLPRYGIVLLGAPITRFLLRGSDVMAPGVDFHDITRMPSDEASSSSSSSSSLPSSSLSPSADRDDGKQLLKFIKRGRIMGVFVPGNQYCVATGICVMDAEEARSGKGRLIQIVSCYGDHLYKKCAEESGISPPNDGF